MPTEIPQYGNPNIDVKFRAEELDRQAALNILAGLSASVAGKKGVLKLVHTTDSKRHLDFEVKSSHQIYELRASKMRHTSGYVRGLFSKVLEGYPPDIKEKFLAELDDYLYAHDNKIETVPLSQFVTRLIEAQTTPRLVEGPYPAPWENSGIKPGVKVLDHFSAAPWLLPGLSTFQDGKLADVEKIGQGGYGDVHRVKVPPCRGGRSFPRASQSYREGT